MKCKASLITSRNLFVSDPQSEHTHSGNVVRKYVGEMKTNMNSDTNSTLSCLKASVAATLDTDVLMALPKRRTVGRSLQRARQKATTAAAAGRSYNPVYIVASGSPFDKPNTGHYTFAPLPVFGTMYPVAVTRVPVTLFQPELKI